MKKKDRDELLGRLFNLTEEIRFVKGQQWKTVYYSLFLYSAFILLVQTDQIVKILERYSFVSIVLSSIVVFVTIMASLFERDHIQSIEINRRKTGAVEKFLDTKWAEKIDKESCAKIHTLDDKLRNTVKYRILFYLLIFLGGGLTILIIFLTTF